jgi:hypothetical protein
VYDLIEIFEPLGMVRVIGGGSFSWEGLSSLLHVFGCIQDDAIRLDPGAALESGLVDRATATEIAGSARGSLNREPFSVTSMEAAMNEIEARGRNEWKKVEGKYKPTNVILRSCLSLFLLGQTSLTTDDLIGQLFPCDANDVRGGMTYTLPAPHLQSMANRASTGTQRRGVHRITTTGFRYKYKSKSELTTGEYYDFKNHSSVCSRATGKAQSGAVDRDQLLQMDLTVKAVGQNKKENATKIRRMYDILNVLGCVGVLEKAKLPVKDNVHFRKGSFPTSWKWVCAPSLDIRTAFLKSPDVPPLVTRKNSKHKR